MINGAEWAMDLGGGLWMVLAVAAGVAVVVALAWLAVSAIPSRRSSTTEDAADILKARFARGEISYQEYEQARRLVEAS